MAWILDEFRAAPGLKPEVDRIFAEWRADPARRDDSVQQAYVRRLAPLGVWVEDAIECPRVGGDEATDRWWRDNIWAPRHAAARKARAEGGGLLPLGFLSGNGPLWEMPFEEALAASRGAFVPELARDRRFLAERTALRPRWGDGVALRMVNLDVFSRAVSIVPEEIVEASQRSGRIEPEAMPQVAESLDRCVAEWEARKAAPAPAPRRGWLPGSAARRLSEADLRGTWECRDARLLADSFYLHRGTRAGKRVRPEGRWCRLSFGPGDAFECAVVSADGEDGEHARFELERRTLYAASDRAEFEAMLERQGDRLAVRFVADGLGGRLQRERFFFDRVSAEPTTRVADRQVEELRELADWLRYWAERGFGVTVAEL